MENNDTELIKKLEENSLVAVITLPSPVNNIIIALVECEDETGVIFESYIAHQSDNETLVQYKMPDYYFMDKSKNNRESIDNQESYFVDHNIGTIPKDDNDKSIFRIGCGLAKYITKILENANVPKKNWGNYKVELNDYQSMDFKHFHSIYSNYTGFFNKIIETTNFKEFREFLNKHKLIKSCIKTFHIEIKEDDLIKINNAE